VDADAVMLLEMIEEHLLGNGVSAESAKQVAI
jgi:hypothetical protein